MTWRTCTTCDGDPVYRNDDGTRTICSDCQGECGYGDDKHECDFEPRRNPATGLLVGVCACGETIDHTGGPI